MKSLKKEAIKSISGLPENATIEDMMYRLYVLENIQQAEAEEARGEIISHKEVGRRIAKWTSIGLKQH